MEQNANRQFEQWSVKHIHQRNEKGESTGITIEKVEKLKTVFITPQQAASLNGFSTSDTISGIHYFAVDES